MKERIRLLETVYKTANQLLINIAEFPKEPNAWEGYLDALDDAVAKVMRFKDDA